MIDRIKALPAHAWLFLLLLLSLTIWEIRPDEVAKNLVLASSSALLLSLRPSQNPPSSDSTTLTVPTKPATTATVTVEPVQPQQPNPT